MLIRFYLDEHIDPVIADGLRRRNIDVTTTVEAGLTHASDDDQLAFANSEHRVFVTRDADFLIRNARGVPRAGIVFLHSKRRAIGSIVLRLASLSRNTTAAEMAGKVEFL